MLLLLLLLLPLQSLGQQEEPVCGGEDCSFLQFLLESLGLLLPQLPALSLETLQAAAGLAAVIGLYLVIITIVMTA